MIFRYFRSWHIFIALGSEATGISGSCNDVILPGLLIKATTVQMWNLFSYLTNTFKLCFYLHYNQEMSIHSFLIIRYVLSRLGRVSGPLRYFSYVLLYFLNLILSLPSNEICVSKRYFIGIMTHTL